MDEEMEEVREALLLAFPGREGLTTVELAELAADCIVALRASQDPRHVEALAAFMAGTAPHDVVVVSTAERLPPELEEIVDRAVTQENYGWRRERPHRKTEE